MASSRICCAVMLALCACVAFARGQKNAERVEDVTDCAVFTREKCGQVAFGINVAATCPVLCASDADRIRRASSNAQIMSKNGHILANTGGLVANLTEIISGDKVNALVEGVKEEVKGVKEEVKEVERRAESDVSNLVKELSKEVSGLGATLAGAIKSLEDQQNKSASESCGAGTQSITFTLEGDGTPTKATGLPWNPIKVPTTPVSDSGGHAVRIIFPTARLISAPEIKIYSCQFTLLDSKGAKTKTVKVSADVAAGTERTFACVTPAWSPAGSGLPPTSKWKTVLSVYENGREMPAPKQVALFVWQPATPKVTMATAFKAKAPKSKATRFTVPFSINYPYGADGYKDVTFSAKGSSSALSSVSVGAPSTTAAPRTLSFTLTDKTGKKTNVYTIEITAKSTKTGLSSKATITINYEEKVGSFGKGGTPEVIQEKPMKDIIAKIKGTGARGTPETWELCYSRDKHGWSTSQFNSRCRQKSGGLFFVQRRGGSSHKGRVWGGFSYDSWPSPSGYDGSNAGKNFLFRINPSNKDQVEWAYNFRFSQYSRYPGNTGYFTCWGGGHDLCLRNDGHAWSGFGHSWRARSGSTSSSWFMGTSSHNAKNENDLYEVYIVK